MTSREDITFKSYRRFLMDLAANLQLAIAEAENVGWHHLEVGPERDHYVRLCTWCKEVDGRMARYSGITAPRV